MPSFSSSSSIRAASQEHVLCLKITHNLVHGPPSDPVCSVKARLPKDLDVLWLSDVAICLSGSLDARQIPAHDITRSGLVHHLHTLLTTNADRLGLNNVSRPFVDDADGLAKLTLTPSRPLPQPSRPHVHLVSLHLAYIWRSVAGRDIDSSSHLVEKSSPFSPTLFLPVEALLNRVTEQILIYHLVGRYPLIFGTWCKRLDLEMQCFPSIASSILEIISRSENRGFLSKCKRLFKTARSQHKFVLQASSAALSSVSSDTAFGSQKEGTDDPFAVPTLTDEQVVCESLEQLFRRGIPQRRFKPIATPKFVLSPQDGDDDLLQFVPDEKADDEASWVELPENLMSPCASLADCLLPEDVDIFAREDWLADETWRRHEADTSPADAMLAPPEFIMCEAQSVESLIDAPVSLASITTRSPEACSFTLYPHQNVDYHELDPAASGLRNQRSQMADLEEPESSVPCTNLTRLPQWTPHDQCFSGEHQQLMEGFLDVSEDFEVVNGWSEGDEDLGSLLFEDETWNGFDVSLDWF